MGRKNHRRKKRRSSQDEQNRIALRRFWARVLAGERRLTLLREFAAVKIAGAYLSPLVVRRRFMRSSVARFDELTLCWSCTVMPASDRHHVIQVQHGGTNIKENVVPVCTICHGLIHPWMEVEEVAPETYRALWAT